MNELFLNNLNEENIEGLLFQTDKNTSAGHLGKDGHNVLQVLNDNKFLYYPNFNVAVFDSGAYLDHEDLHSFTFKYLGSKNSFHGTGSSSVFSTSEAGNNLGTQGIINTHTVFISKTSPNTENIYNSVLEKYNPRTTNHSQILYKCTSYEGFKIATYKGNNPDHIRAAKKMRESCNIDLNSSYGDKEAIAHVKSFSYLRKLLQKYKNTLFVFGAGNSKINALWSNGAIQYSYNKETEKTEESITFDPLDNVIIVAATGYDNTLHYYSNYGESVQVAGIAGVLAPSCSDSNTNTNYYYNNSDSNQYGEYRSPADHSIYGKDCLSQGEGVENIAFKGTSAASPIVAGIGALLLSLDSSVTPAEVKKLLIQHGKTITKRYTGQCIKGVCTTADLPTKNSNGEIIQLPVKPDLFAAYTSLKKKALLEVEANIQLLHQSSLDVNSFSDCHTLWTQSGITESLLKKDSKYKLLWHNNKCLYFRGNSYIIEYSPDTKLAQYLYFGDTNYINYRIVNNFIQNIQYKDKLNINNAWRIGYGVGKNAFGNIACIIEDDKPCPNVQNDINNCQLLWKNTTGLNPNDVNITVAQANNGECLYSHEKSQQVIQYNFLSPSNSLKTFTGAPFYSVTTDTKVSTEGLIDFINDKLHQIQLYDTGGDLCNNFLEGIFIFGKPYYLTGFIDPANNNVCNFKHSTNNDLVKLNLATRSIKVIDLTEIEVQYDTQLLNNKEGNISSTNDCTIFWQQNNVERDVIGSKKVYEPLFYGNKCLYFRGDSFIIEYDTPTKQAKYLSYGDNHYDEYQAVFKFVTNINKAQIDPDFRKKLGLLLNKHGVVGCSYSNKEFCTPVYAGDSKYKALYQTHPEDCSILWNIVTESGIMDHEAYPSKSNIGSNLQTAHRCVYKPQEHNGNGMNGDHAILIQYDFLTGEVITNQKKTDNMYDMYLKLIQLSIKHKETNSWSDDYVKLENKNSLFILNGIPICSPDFYKPTSWYPNYPGYEIYKKDGCQNDINGIYSSYSIDWSDACQSIISALYPNDPLLKNRTSAKTSRVNDYLTFDIFNNDIICAFSKDAQSIAIDDNHIYFHSNMYQSNGNFSKFTLGSQRFY